MSAHFPLYLLESAGLLLGSTLVYWLLFWRSTFLNWNRVLLLSILIGSIALPLIHLPVEWTVWHKPVSLAPTTQTSTTSTDTNLPDNIAVFEENPMTQGVTTPKVAPTPTPINYQQVLLGIYLLGVGVMSVRMLLQVLSLLKLYRKARIEQRDGYQLSICPTELSPFAFGSVIFVPQSWFDQAESELILTHELAHVRQKHTFDILLAELNLVWQWFNPAAWMYRRLVECNLEYLADRSVLHQHGNKKRYQLSLLNWVNAESSNSLSTSFNYSLLKERIKMMNRKNSPRAYALRYALIAFALPALTIFNRPLSKQNLGDGVGSSQLISPLDSKPNTGFQTINANEGIELTENRAERLSVSATKNTTPINPSSIATPAQKDTLLATPDFYIIIGKNATSAELEKFSTEASLPYNKKIAIEKDAQGNVTELGIKSDGAYCRSDLTDFPEGLPAVLIGRKGGCGFSYLELSVLDNLAAADWSSRKIYTIGIPTTKQALEAFRPRAIAVQEEREARMLARLKACNWVDTHYYSHMTYNNFTEKAIKHLHDRVQKCLDEHKELVVIVNGGAPQNSLPKLENLKLTKIDSADKYSFYYVEGTTKLIKEEMVGLKLEIFTED